MPLSGLSAYSKYDCLITALHKLNSFKLLWQSQQLLHQRPPNCWWRLVRMNGVCFNVWLCKFAGTFPGQQAELRALLKVLHRRRAQGDFRLCQEPAVHRCSQRAAERAWGSDVMWRAPQRRKCSWFSIFFYTDSLLAAHRCVVALKIAFCLTCHPFVLRNGEETDAVDQWQIPEIHSAWTYCLLLPTSVPCRGACR